jgi:hypothetical protein
MAVQKLLAPNGKSYTKSQIDRMTVRQTFNLLKTLGVAQESQYKDHLAMSRKPRSRSRSRTSSRKTRSRKTRSRSRSRKSKRWPYYIAPKKHYIYQSYTPWYVTTTTTKKDSPAKAPIKASPAKRAIRASPAKQRMDLSRYRPDPGAIPAFRSGLNIPAFKPKVTRSAPGKMQQGDFIRRNPFI